MLYLITLERIDLNVGVVVRPMSEVVFFRVLCTTSDDLPMIHFAARAPHGQQERLVKMAEIVSEAELPDELKQYQELAELDNEEELERKGAKDGQPQAN
jgi:hypothetical protein